MNCPKCGAAAASGSDECGSCGLIFSRWRERMLRPVTHSPAPVVTEEATLPKPVVIAGIAVFIVLGMIWTAHRHSARAQDDPTKVLDEINQSGRPARDEAKARPAAMRPAPAAPKAAAGLPPDLTEENVRNLIEACDYFQQSNIVAIPKIFDAQTYASVLSRYPAIPVAAAEGLIEFDPPFDAARASDAGWIEVKVPPAALYKVPVVRDNGEEHLFDFGRRRVETIRLPRTNPDGTVVVEFTVTLEQPAGLRLLPDTKNAAGEAELRRNGAHWIATRTAVGLRVLCIQ